MLKKIFNDFERVTETNIFDEYKKDIYVIKNFVMSKKQIFIDNNIMNAKHFDSTKLHHYKTSKKIYVRRERFNSCHYFRLNQIQ